MEEAHGREHAAHFAVVDTVPPEAAELLQRVAVRSASFSAHERISRTPGIAGAGAS